MNKIVLINEGKLPHYRIPVYNYLQRYLMERKKQLFVVSEDFKSNNSNSTNFQHTKMRLSLINLLKYFRKTKPTVVIFWVNPHLVYVCSTNNNQTF